MADITHNEYPQSKTRSIEGLELPKGVHLKYKPMHILGIEQEDGDVDCRDEGAGLLVTADLRDYGVLGYTSHNDTWRPVLLKYDPVHGEAEATDKAAAVDKARVLHCLVGKVVHKRALRHSKKQADTNKRYWKPLPPLIGDDGRRMSSSGSKSLPPDYYMYQILMSALFIC